MCFGFYSSLPIHIPYGLYFSSVVHEWAYDYHCQQNENQRQEENIQEMAMLKNDTHEYQ